VADVALGLVDGGRQGRALLHVHGLELVGELLDGKGFTSEASCRDRHTNDRQARISKIADHR
jgi:hypothetical protein